MKLDNTDLKRNVLLKDAHLDTLTSEPLHLDFYEITEGEEVKVSAPLSLLEDQKVLKVAELFKH